MFLLVEVVDATWVLAIPDGGGAGPVLAQLADRIYDYGLTVEPAQVWGVLPSPVGAQTVDLTTGEVRGPLELACGPNLDVQQVLPGGDGTGAVLMGECDDPRDDTQMLWLIGRDRIGQDGGMLTVDEDGDVAVLRIEHGRVNALDLELLDALTAAVTGSDRRW